MPSFSERYNLNPNKQIQLEDVDLPLLNRLWNIFYEREYETEIFALGGGVGVTEYLLDSFGLIYEYPQSSFNRNSNIEKLRNFLIDAEWYLIYDFVERYVSYFQEIKERKKLEKEINQVLEEEKSGYRMLDGLITPITNKSELDSLKESMSTEYISVNTHMEKALQLFSQRKSPDYENSIKESISAVEAMCCIITGETGSQATLGKTIKKLKDKGIHIHSAMESAFSALYGYTSDEDGIRHGSIGFTNAPAEDAKYMLVSCSAFVNYLIEKWSKVSD
ncbi:hypothetical protein I4200191B4_12110 [Pseudoflavonifractor gallinarum]|uniref:AbiJ-NTD4 domain-containing protein n=1 Tax=Eubacteriales TaxID=186802 RepID=UPI00189A4B8D|nr:hypothetical protein [Clostridium sp. J1101437_171009_A5]